MFNGKKYDQLLDFVEYYRTSLHTDKEIVLCENYAANSVMTHYIALAKEAGAWNIGMKYALANDSDVDNVDLCMLLGNLLENAIDGCKTVPVEARKIKLLTTRASALMVSVSLPL